MSKQLASIIIDNFNNGRFLADAINSALSQTYSPLEIIVVDDGSTDDSGEIIHFYQRRCKGKLNTILKENGGQASALNAGFNASTGDVVFFLDADDVLYPTAAANVVPTFRGSRVAKVHWPLLVIDADGHPTGEVVASVLSEGDLREEVLGGGPYMYQWAPTSGNAWTRAFLEAVLPIPEAKFKRAPETYLAALSPLFGSVRRCEPQGCWRRHQNNKSQLQVPFDEGFSDWLERFDACLTATQTQCRRLGIPFELGVWKKNSWYHRIERVVAKIISVVPVGRSFILVDQAQWAMTGTVKGRKSLPFLERNGCYGGPPADDATAISELERMREGGAKVIVFGWQAFWWLDQYRIFSRHLWSQYLCLVENDDMIMFLLDKA